jgi:hypothetical protein
LLILSFICSNTHAQAQYSNLPKSTIARTIADFNHATLSKIAVGKGVTIKRIDDNTLEVRIAPFSQHHNQWPMIAFGPNFFGEPISLAEFSRIGFRIEQQSEGMLGGEVGITTAPDATRDVDEQEFMVPGDSTKTIKLGLKALKFNDSSEISVIQIVFRPREAETVLRLSAISGVYEPAVGSPADDLQNRIQAANASFAKLKETNDSPQVTELGEELNALNAEVMGAHQTQFLRSLRSLSRKTEEIEGLIGRVKFAGSGPIWVWQADRYSPIIRKTDPGVQDEAMKQVSLSMAGNEFRDFVFFIRAPESDLSLTLAVHPTGENNLPGNAVEISEVDYRNNRQGEQTGDALLPLNGPVVIPQGESRQFWVRFNTRTAAVAPGKYAFELEISDPSRQLRMAYPGTLEVWNFALPSYDVLPNNSYAEFPSSSFSSGEGFKQAVQEMKLYGLNQIFVDPDELPRPTGIDESGKITGYDDAEMRTRITEAMAAWKGAPGDESLHFIFSLSGFQELGLKRDGYAFLNDQWKALFAQWLNHLKAVTSEAGLGYDQWMLVLGDEADESALMKVEIPLAEVIKSLDPSIQITCNSSTILNDEEWTKRYFAVFDVFEPCLWRDETLAWLRKSGKPLWVYQCDCDLGFTGRDLYGYYRVYGWDLLDKGFTGIGLWTYSAEAPSSWDDPGQGCLLIYLHPQRGLVHSPRYELYREGADDYRYVKALQLAAEKKGPDAAAHAEALIAEAVKDVTSNRQDRSRCETWRVRIAKEILSMQ